MINKNIQMKTHLIEIRWNFLFPYYYMHFSRQLVNLVSTLTNFESKTTLNANVSLIFN